MVILDIRLPDPTKLTDEAKKILFDDFEVLDEISGILLSELQNSLQSGAFLPLKPETLAKKKRLGEPSTPLMGSGTLLRNLRSGVTKKGHKAFARRGKDQVYGFFHQFGIGRNEKREWVKEPDGDVRTRVVTAYEADMARRFEAFSAVVE